MLLALAHLGKDAYGMTVRRAIESRTGRDVAIGAVYGTLDRLERKGLVESRLDEGGSERSGRARRFVELTREGADALRRSRAMHDRMWRGVDLGSLPGGGAR